LLTSFRHSCRVDSGPASRSTQPGHPSVGRPNESKSWLVVVTAAVSLTRVGLQLSPPFCHSKFTVTRRDGQAELGRIACSHRSPIPVLAGPDVEQLRLSPRPISAPVLPGIHADTEMLVYHQRQLDSIATLINLALTCSGVHAGGERRGRSPRPNKNTGVRVSFRSSKF